MALLSGVRDQLPRHGTVWANHHNRFRFIVRSDHVLLFLNTLFLMWIEKIMRIVLHEAHGWQVEETMDTLSEGPESSTAVTWTAEGSIVPRHLRVALIED